MVGATLLGYAERLNPERAIQSPHEARKIFRMRVGGHGDAQEVSFRDRSVRSARAPHNAGPLLCCTR